MPRTFSTLEEFEEAYPNIRGAGIGPNGELIVLVAQKVAESDLASDEIIPEEITIDGETRETDLYNLKGVPHLTSASGDVEWYATVPADHRRRYRPIPGGVSIGNNSIGAGTMGSPLLEHDGDPVVLTNAHVAGTSYEHFQPASMDGGAEAEPIGTFREASDLNPDEPQTTDSALINVDPEDIDDTILGIGALAGFDRADFTHGQYTKSGRTTGVTQAPLRAVDTSVRVTYGEKTIRFTGCDVFGDLSAPGDSGSLIGYETSDDGLMATSLLFAGSSRATIGIPILTGVFDYHGTLTIPGDDEEDDSGNSDGRDGSENGSGGSSGDGSNGGSDSDDNDNGDQDHTPELTFEDYVVDLLREEYGEENVKRQYYLSYSGRYADLVVFDPEHERMEGWELENDKGSVLNGSGQARFYAQSLMHEFPEKGGAIPVLCIPDGHIDPEERRVIELSGVMVREIETPEDVSLEGV